MSGPENPGRRKFILGAAAAAATVAGVSFKTPKTRADILPEKISSPDSPERMPAGFVILPEYLRQMKEVVFSFHIEDLEDLFGGKYLERPDIFFFLDIIRNLPKTAKIKLVTDRITAPVLSQNIDDFLKKLKEMGFTSVSHIKSGINTQNWSQDHGESMKNSNTEELFLLVPKLEMGMRRVKTHILAGYRETLGKYAGRIIQAPFFFQGGNFQAIEMPPDGKMGIAIGYSDFELSCPPGVNIEDHIKDTTQVISNFFHGAEVLVLGKGPQGRLAFHLDQGVLFLPNNQVIVSQVFSDAEEPIQSQNILIAKKRFDEYAEQLAAAGFKVHRHRIDPNRAERYMFNINAITFGDGDKTKILIPLFKSDFDRNLDKTQLELSDVSPESPAVEIYNICKALGHDPVFVRDYVNLHENQKGSIHCVIQQRADARVNPPVNSKV